MTQQEFVKKESDRYSNFYYTKETFKSGLTKGLEIAKEFQPWVKKYKDTQYESAKGEDVAYAKKRFIEIKNLTTDELLTIFLTEKYGQ